MLNILSTEENEANLLNWTPKKKTPNPISPARAVVLQNQYIFRRCHEDFMESLQNVKIKTRKGEKNRPAMQCLTSQVSFVGVRLQNASDGRTKSLGMPEINRAHAAHSRGLLPSAKLAKPTLVTWWLDPLYPQEGDLLGPYHDLQRFPSSSLLYCFPSIRTHLQIHHQPLAHLRFARRSMVDQNKLLARKGCYQNKCKACVSAIKMFYWLEVSLEDVEKAIQEVRKQEVRCRAKGGWVVFDACTQRWVDEKLRDEYQEAKKEIEKEVEKEVEKGVEKGVDEKIKEIVEDKMKKVDKDVEKGMGDRTPKKVEE